MYTTLNYLEQAQWDGKPTQEGWTGCCPVHPEKHPSFQLRPDRWHPGEWIWICYHEHQVGDLPALVNIREFGGINTPSVWHEVFKRCTSLGANLPQKMSMRIEQLEKPGANEEQRQMLTAVMHWWHEQLWYSSYRKRGQDYYRKRGISVTDLKFHHQIGYAPPTWEESVRKNFFDLLQDTGGKDWKKTATDLGLLSAKGYISLWDRIMFSSVNDQGECVSFQGRSVELPGDTRDILYPYLGTKTVQKIPFSLAIPDPSQSWVMDIESPVGTALLAPYGIRSIAWEGAPRYGLIRSLLEQDPDDRIIGMDHDTVRFYSDGRPYQPGELHAQKLRSVYQEVNRSYKELYIPPDWKDVDTWVCVEGIDPLLQQVS
jgi:hypothetical protein